jgi:hypothetical protein
MQKKFDFVVENPHLKHEHYVSYNIHRETSRNNNHDIIYQMLKYMSNVLFLLIMFILY